MKIQTKQEDNRIFWVVVGLSFLIFLLPKIIAFFSKFMNLITDPFNTEAQEVENEAKEENLNDLAGEFNWSTLPKAKAHYMVLADQQFNAMEYSGTDFDALINPLKNLTSDELLAVFHQYGARYLHTLGITDSHPKTLLEAYRDELSDINPFGLTQIEEMQEVWNKTGLVI